MKLFELRGIKLINDWTIETLHIEKPYGGLMEGNPRDPLAKKIFENVIHKVMKNTSGFGEHALNQVPRLQENGLLKKIKIEVDITDGTMDKHSCIITYMDETEELEEVLNNVILDPEFVAGELEF